MSREIEEMAKILCGMKNGCDGCMWDKVHCNERNCAEEIYNAGYRKQHEGENVAMYPSSEFECSECHWEDWDLYTADSPYNFCPHCGAKMKGGAGQ